MPEPPPRKPAFSPFPGLDAGGCGTGTRNSATADDALFSARRQFFQCAGPSRAGTAALDPIRRELSRLQAAEHEPLLLQGCTGGDVQVDLADADDHGRLQFCGGWQDDGSQNPMVGKVAGMLHAVVRFITHLFGS